MGVVPGTAIAEDPRKSRLQGYLTTLGVRCVAPPRWCPYESAASSRVGSAGFGGHFSAFVPIPGPPPPPLTLWQSLRFRGSGRYYGVLQYLVAAAWVQYPEETATHKRVSRSTAHGRRGLGMNNLDGTLPAELGKLTNLDSLCVTLRRRRAAIGGPVSAALMRCARWCAATVARTSSAARSGAGSARWRSSSTCKPLSATPSWGGGGAWPRAYCSAL